MAQKTFKNTAAAMFMTTQEEKAPAVTPAADPAADGIQIPKGYRLAPELKSDRMQLLVTPTIKAGIKRLAAIRGTSMNDLMNEILAEYVERNSE